MNRTLSEQLRLAILDSGTSRYKLARATGLSEGALSRFMAGKRGLNLESAERLASHFGLTLADGGQWDRLQHISKLINEKKITLAAH